MSLGGAIKNTIDELELSRDEIITPSKDSPEKSNSEISPESKNDMVSGDSQKAKKSILIKKKGSKANSVRHDFVGNKSVIGSKMPKLLMKKKGRRSNLKTKRNNLENSLVYTAMIDIQDASRIKTRYVEPSHKSSRLGKMFMSFDLRRKL